MYIFQCTVWTGEVNFIVYDVVTLPLVFVQYAAMYDLWNI